MGGKITKPNSDQSKGTERPAGLGPKRLPTMDFSDQIGGKLWPGGVLPAEGMNKFPRVRPGVGAPHGPDWRISFLG